ncbi:hypothetical protein [Aquimarina latercula]|uniref:hypothetical protein n=1 Tax=Aquimarina latercula TaxID=987 RepID=UPI00042214B1|nr:hypothetical protein [Aquimarina latercula]
MVEKDLNSEIKDLKELLSKDQISLYDAIDQFIFLIENFQKNQHEDIVLFNVEMSSINRELIEKNNKIKERIKSLNRIIVLQELGIKFDQEEINSLLSK